ncbi:MAG: hypothetical protein PF505_09605 [Vallitaleaceae bacterium]|jgi:hypothetical protein|nr:hypothetical protein [Vallitaleaceae bacterium]
MKNELIKKYKRIKYTKLVISIIIDLIGNASYLFPVIGGIVDIPWAFLSGGVMMFALYPNHKIGAAGGAIEEILPGTDIIPTACILWIIDYIKNDKKTFAEFVRNEVDQEQLIDEILNTHNMITKKQ